MVYANKYGQWLSNHWPAVDRRNDQKRAGHPPTWVRTALEHEQDPHHDDERQKDSESQSQHFLILLHVILPCQQMPTSAPAGRSTAVGCLSKPRTPRF